jgi:hypothetical protein
MQYTLLLKQQRWINPSEDLPIIKLVKLFTSVPKARYKPVILVLGGLKRLHVFVLKYVVSFTFTVDGSHKLKLKN